MKVRWLTVSAVLLIASMATLAQSYILVKLVFLALFLAAFAVSFFFYRMRPVLHPRLVRFYLWIGFAGLAWAFIGALHYRNYLQGIYDSLRLYIAWSVAFVILYTIIRAQSLRVFHAAMVVAGILIPLINFVGLYDQLMGGGLIPFSVKEELGMEIGLGNGYFQITSLNIGAMFLIVPYLISLQFRADDGKSNSLLTKLSLALSLVLVVVSGRRALWILVALTPCAILLLSKLTNSYDLLRRNGKRLLLASTAACAIGLATLAAIPEDGYDIGSITRLKQAFSSEDERTIQAPYLLHAFMKSPVLGSGFGGYAGYLRSEERPWTYELTYHRLLFNMGIVGMAFMATLFCWYFVFVIKNLRQFKEGSAIPFALLIGWCSLLAGAYSNPYLSSFDFLFFVGLLPYLSTFDHGFGH